LTVKSVRDLLSAQSGRPDTLPDNNRKMTDQQGSGHDELNNNNFHNTPFHSGPIGAAQFTYCRLRRSEAAHVL
jgi:hypothetical protein